MNFSHHWWLVAPASCSRTDLLFREPAASTQGGARPRDTLRLTAVAESPAVFCLAATVQLKVSALLPEPPA